jgi:DinB family protein
MLLGSSRGCQEAFVEDIVAVTEKVFCGRLPGRSYAIPDSERRKFMMKRAAVRACLILCISVAAFAQSLTPADRSAGVAYLEKTRDGVIAATKGLSEAEWNFKAGPDRWSIAQVMEHIARAEDFLFDNVKTKVMAAPAGPADRDVKKVDAAVLAMVPDRSHKFQAPPPLVPDGKWATPGEALDHFLKARAQTIAFMQATPDLREHVSDSPLGPLDGYESLLFIGAHSERHTKQMLEVKDDPKYPKN